MVNATISTRRFVIACFLRVIQTDRPQPPSTGLASFSSNTICRHLGQYDIPISHLQTLWEAIGVDPGLLPSGVLGAQPRSVGQRPSPSVHGLLRREGTDGAIESTGRIFMRKTLW